MITTRWHIQCLQCEQRFYEPVVRVFNAGYDWEDSESYCPSCGKALQDHPGYRMVDGPIPAPAFAHSERDARGWHA